ncbi:MAG: hypothetical protein KDE26_08775 [Bacteroidetes bacterium]|nr:hypothetical protein [Bacteroidota bacterium]MCB0843332.1 hypothetical protein [Bacteroidota bacterium]
MTNLILDRAEELIIKAKAKAGKEMQVIGNTNWLGLVPARESAVNMVRHAFSQTEKIIKNALQTTSGNEEVQEAWNLFATTQLDIAQYIIEREVSTELQIAQLQGFSISINHQREEFEKIKELAPQDITQDLKTFSGASKSASNLLKEVATNPIKYYDIAHQFITGKVAKVLPKAFTSKLPSAPDTTVFIDFLKKQGATSDSFLNGRAFFTNAVKWLGIAQIGFAITTVIFETFSNQGKWSNTFASAVVASGAGIALGSVITGSAVTSVITATLAVAGVTAEVPPIAAAVIAAGIVILSAIAISALFDALIDLIFDTDGIPPSMRLSMTSRTFSNMSTQMSSSMASSMVSLPR